MSLELILGFLFIITVAGAVERYRSGPDPEQFEDIEHLREAYVNGEVSQSLFESAATRLTHPDTVQFQLELEREIGGVGPRTAVNIVRRYPLPEAVENATVEDLMEVHEVGPSLATEMKEIYD